MPPSPNCSNSLSQTLSIRTLGYAPPERWRSCMLCGGFIRTLSTRGSKLMFSSSSWRASWLVRALIAVGLAIIGVGLVWAALARPSTPNAATDPAPNDHSMPSTSATVSQPTSEPSTAPADQADLRDQTTGLVLPESDPVDVSIPKTGVQSRLVNLGLDTDGTMDVPQNPARAG